MKKIILFIALITSIHVMQAQEKLDVNRPLSPTIRVDNQLFISGQVGIDRSTSKLQNESFEAEVKQVMVNLQNLLKQHDLTLDDLTSTIIYLKDMNMYARLNQVYGSYFKLRFPTRTCIAVADLPAGASVEISGIAHFKTLK